MSFRILLVGKSPGLCLYPFNHSIDCGRFTDKPLASPCCVF